MVDRLVLISNQQIVLDGPRDDVIATLQKNAKKSQGVAQTAPSEAPKEGLND
jgi:hypothetical protein